MLESGGNAVQVELSTNHPDICVVGRLPGKVFAATKANFQPISLHIGVCEQGFGLKLAFLIQGQRQGWQQLFYPLSLRWPQRLTTAPSK